MRKVYLVLEMYGSEKNERVHMIFTSFKKAKEEIDTLLSKKEIRNYKYVIAQYNLDDHKFLDVWFE